MYPVSASGLVAMHQSAHSDWGIPHPRWLRSTGEQHMSAASVYDPCLQYRSRALRRVMTDFQAPGSG